MKKRIALLVAFLLVLTACQNPIASLVGESDEPSSPTSSSQEVAISEETSEVLTSSTTQESSAISSVSQPESSEIVSSEEPPVSSESESYSFNYQDIYQEAKVKFDQLEITHTLQGPDEYGAIDILSQVKNNSQYPLKDLTISYSLDTSYLIISVPGTLNPGETSGVNRNYGEEDTDLNNLVLENVLYDVIDGFTEQSVIYSPEDAGNTTGIGLEYVAYESLPASISEEKLTELGQDQRNAYEAGIQEEKDLGIYYEPLITPNDIVVNITQNETMDMLYGSITNNSAHTINYISVYYLSTNSNQYLHLFVYEELTPGSTSSETMIFNTTLADYNNLQAKTINVDINAENLTQWYSYDYTSQHTSVINRNLSEDTGLDGVDGIEVPNFSYEIPEFSVPDFSTTPGFSYP